MFSLGAPEHRVGCNFGEELAVIDAFASYHNHTRHRYYWYKFAICSVSVWLRQGHWKGNWFLEGFVAS